MIDFWIFPLSTIWGAYHLYGFPAFVLSLGSTLTLFVGGVMESFMWFEIKFLLTQVNMDSILVTKITRRAYK